MTPRLLAALLLAVPGVAVADDTKPARDGKPEFAPRGADSGVPGVQSYFLPAAGPKFVPFKRTGKPVIPDTLQLVFLARTQPVRVELKVTGTGSTLAERWEANLKALFTAFDRDGDGYLNRHEAERIFSKSEFRQIIQGGYGFRGQGSPPTVEALDRDGDGRVSFEEMADYYEGEVAALLKARINAIPNYNEQVDRLTPELFARFDTNNDGKLSEAELKDAERMILALDGDEDECVSAAEILANPVRKLVASAGATGAMPAMPAMPGMTGPSGASATVPTDFQAHVGPLPGALVQQVIKKYDKNGDFLLTREEIGFDQATFDRLDANKDGKLSAAELDAWRTGPPDLMMTFALGTESADARLTVTPEKGPPAVSVAADGNRAILLVGTQTVDLAPYAIPASARQQIQNPYAYVFPTGKDFVTEADLTGPQNQFLRVVFEPADFDGDGRLTKAEFDRYFAIQRATGELGISLGHSTRMPNLFQLLDQNGDGKLSVRELRTAYKRIAPLEPSGGKEITKAILQPSVVVRVGPSLTAAFDQSLYNVGGNPVAAAVPSKGPLWFRKMDRNGDGDVSRAEFLGTKAEFDAIDTDGDGLITLAEAEAFDKKVRPPEKK